MVTSRRRRHILRILKGSLTRVGERPPLRLHERGRLDIRGNLAATGRLRGSHERAQPSESALGRSKAALTGASRREEFGAEVGAVGCGFIEAESALMATQAKQVKRLISRFPVESLFSSALHRPIRPLRAVKFFLQTSGFFALKSELLSRDALLPRPGVSRGKGLNLSRFAGRLRLSATAKPTKDSLKAQADALGDAWNS